MDNNNFQPQPNMNSAGMNQPYPNGQPQPMNQPPMSPMQQPLPPKPPMDPAKKKKLVLGLSLGGGALVLIILAVILIPILTRIDYAPAYSAAKELKPKIYDIYQSYDCERVIDYVDSSYTTVKSYNEYVENCKTVYNSGADGLIAKLETTDAVKRNQEIKAQFEKFKSEYATVSSGSTEDLAAKLALWQARHSFVVAADDLNYSRSSDAEYTAAANYLIESGNDSLKTYGEGWLEKSLAIAATYALNYNSGSGDCTEFLGEVICD